MLVITMDMVKTTGFAIIVLLIGTFVRKRVRFFHPLLHPGPCHRRSDLFYYFHRPAQRQPGAVRF